MLSFFTKNELKIISTIFIFLFLVTGFNIFVSLRKGRDATRKNDMSALQKAVDLYRQKYKIYPLSTPDGKIIGCFNEDPKFDKKTGLVTNAIPCEWGVSSFENIKTMNQDPRAKDGYSYLYISNGLTYKLYVSLEGTKEAEYQKELINQNLQCGSHLCNYGRGSNL